jgi:hypothetical protein
LKLSTYAFVRSLVKPYTKDLVDCAAYTLTIGHEVYVSPSTQATEPQNATVRRLADGEALPLFHRRPLFTLYVAPSRCVAIVPGRAA